MSTSSNMIETDPNRLITDWQENAEAPDWEDQPTVRKLISMDRMMRMYWFAQKNAGDYLLPPAVYGVEKIDHRILAAYHLRRNAMGIQFYIAFNQVHTRAGGALEDDFALHETQVHELTHCYMENSQDLPKASRGYHPRAMVELMKELGINMREGAGSHFAPADRDSQFERLMLRCGVARPENASDVAVPPEAPKLSWWDVGRDKRKGTSTLIKWVCKCDPPFNIRTGRRDLAALCLRCEQPFMPEGVG